MPKFQVTGRIVRIASCTDPVARLVPQSNEVIIETMIHFMIENDATIYTTRISRLSSRETVAAITLARIGDEVAFSMTDPFEEVGDFRNLTLRRRVRLEST